MTQVPPLFANALRYAPGDHVRTPFGSGIVRSLSDQKAHVEVELAFGATLYARRGCLLPEFRMLECGEIPKDTLVIVCFSAQSQEDEETDEECDTNASVQSFHVREQKYEVVWRGSDQQKHELRLAPRTRVRTKLGLGVILEYRKASDSYAVKLDFGGIGYIVPQDVSCVDLRLLEKVPKPLSAEQIVAQFEGRVTLDDAKVLSEKAHETYRRVQRFCEQHAETISFLSTNAMYGDQYSKALGSLFDPSLAEAKDRIKTAGTNELEKLKQMAFSAKKTLESELLDGKDSSAFFAQAAKVLSQLKNSSEVKDLSDTLRLKANDELELAKKKMQIESNSPQGQRLVLSQVLQALESKVNAQKPKIDKIKSSLDQDTLQSELLTKLQQHEADFFKAQEAIAHLEKLASAKMGVTSLTSMDPSQLIAKAEELLPQVSKRAGVFMESTEKYLAQMQQTSQGQTLLKKAKQLVQSVDNPDAFCDNVTKAIADVKLDKLAEWGSTLTTNREKRQEFVNQVKDHCLDFFMSVLPSIKIDTISGIEEGVEYSMSNLDLSNFRVRKERVKVRMGTVADEELFTVRATHLTALLKGFQWTFAQKYFPYLNGGGLADAELTGGMISLGFKAEKVIVNKVTGEVRPTLVLNSMEIEIKQELKITVQGSWFSAVYNLLASVFAELIREYLAKTMESKLLGHMIKLLKTLNDQMDEYWPLIFQLLDIRVDDLPSASPWRGAKEVDIQPNQVECTFEDRSMVPFTFAKGVLHKHVVITSRIADVSDTNAADLMRVPVGASVLAVNGLACNKLNLDEFKAILEKLATPFTMRFSLVVEDTGMNRLQRVVPRQQSVSVTFKQDGPFGFRLRSRPLSPFGSIVVGFTEPSADGKKSAAELSGKIQAGQLLLKVNDIDLRFKSLQETLQILKETTRRPATLHFAPSPDGIIKLRDWPPMIEMELSDEEAADGRNYCVVSAFARVPSFAQKSHRVQKGDVLLRVNDVSMLTPIYEQNNFATIMETLKQISDAKQPMHAVFVSSEQYTDLRRQIWEAISLSASSTSADSVSQTETAAPTSKETDNDANEESSKNVRVEDAVVTAFLATIMPKEIVFPKAPLGILFGNLNDEAVYIRQFISSTGAAEKSGLIHIGQAVLQVCGKTVPADATPAVIEQMIADVATRAKPPSSYTLTVRDLDLERELMK
uniref:PDZ domain-containing protein n=1 Tax=Globisporangium ultimum (strain ATCC 200006 / CBS 805.95 / DAOM BR144) TaxID=431595 RepID=K3XBA8_GLOUD